MTSAPAEVVLETSGSCCGVDVHGDSLFTTRALPV